MLLNFMPAPSVTANRVSAAHTLRLNVLTAIHPYSNFTLHNSPGIYTHFPRQVQGFNPSIIDLTLTSSIAPEMILSWHSDRNTISSDHSISILH
jgi:hypothetical protein